MRKPGSIVHIRKLIKKTIYRLKWTYGVPVDIYRETQGTFNPSTGVTPIIKNKWHVDRMIVLPGLIHRDFFFSITVIRANSNFITGGDVLLNDRQFIIDARDLPADFVLTADDYLIKDGKRWDFTSVSSLDEETGYFIVGRSVLNQIVNQIYDNGLKQISTLTSEFSNVP